MVSCIDFAKKPSYLIENGGKKSNSFYKNKKLTTSRSWLAYSASNFPLHRDSHWFHLSRALDKFWSVWIVLLVQWFSGTLSQCCFRNDVFLVQRQRLD